MTTSELTHARIAERAHQIYLVNGSHPGHDLDDWLQAQYELVGQPVLELAKIEPYKRSRMTVSAAFLIGVVNSALLFGRMR